MQPGGFFSSFDIAQVTLYAFWIFFAGLVFYLRTEDKREGYPLHSDKAERLVVQGFPPVPRPKKFLLADGRVVTAPRIEQPSGPGAATPVANWPGAPLRPNGDPMLDSVGPASYAMRIEKPDILIDGQPRLVPLRNLPAYSLAAESADPRGMAVLGADRQTAGVVKDIWVDIMELVIRYLEIEVTGGGARVLLPMPLAKIDARTGRVTAKSVLARHFGSAPVLANPDQVTLREEDRISAYFVSGHLYATPDRSEPVL